VSGFFVQAKREAGKARKKGKKARGEKGMSSRPLQKAEIFIKHGWVLLF
jgi:hypothetical protein